MDKDDAGGGSRRAGELERDGEVLAPITGRSGTRSEDLQSSEGILVDIAGGDGSRGGAHKHAEDVPAQNSGSKSRRGERLPEDFVDQVAGGSRSDELDLDDHFLSKVAGGSGSRSGELDLADVFVAQGAGGSRSRSGEHDLAEDIIANFTGGSGSSGGGGDHARAGDFLGQMRGLDDGLQAREAQRIRKDVWQGEFFLREEALSGQKAVDELNEALVDSYNLVSVVLRQKHVSVLLSVIKDSYKDEIDDNSVKTCVSEIRSKCRGLRQEILMLHGTPIREPVEYWRDKYHLASF